MPARAVVAAAAMLALLAGCGQTGPLHLPADAPDNEAYLIGGNPNARKADTKKTAKPATAPAAEPAPEAPAEAAPEAPATTTP